MNPSTRWILAVFVSFAVTVAGCNSNADRGTVHGAVTLNGEPLKTGIIRFVPVDGQSATADGPITDGEFNVEVPPGEKRVEISAPKVVGQTKMIETSQSPAVDIVEELLPARYNVQSELRITVSPGTQEEVFELRSAR
jgi:hypothetical protein